MIARTILLSNLYPLYRGDMFFLSAMPCSHLSDAGGGGDGVEEVLAGGRGPQLHVELGLVRRHGHVQVSLPHLALARCVFALSLTEGSLHLQTGKLTSLS